MKRLIIIFFLFAASAAAQGVRYSSTVTQQGTIGTSTNVVVLPAAPVIAFCTHPANAVPCTNKATTYTDQTLATPCSTSTQIVRDGTNTCVASPDSQNNWGVWFAPNSAGYDFTVMLAGGVNLGPFNVLSQTTTISTIVGPVTISGAVTFTGAVTATGGVTVNTNPLALPNTTSASNGVITFGGTPFIHDFGTGGALGAWVGLGAGNFTFTGFNNNGFGYHVLQAVTSGSGNNGFGTQALQANTSGTSNNAFGGSALFANTTGGSNSAFGDGTLVANTTGIQNSAFGAQAMAANTTAVNNTAFGVQALSSLVGGTNTNSSAFGVTALKSVTTGVNNNGFGTDALRNLLTGSFNIAIGTCSGCGGGSGANYTGAESNNINIGNTGTLGESNAIHIGFPGSHLTATIGSLTLPINTISTPSSSTFLRGDGVWATPAGLFTSVNVTPVTVSANVSTDQNGMAITITAGALNAVSRTLLIQLAGVYSTPAASTTALTHKLKLCTVSGCGSGTVITLASWTSSALGGVQATNNPYNVTINSSTQTAGASAAFEAHGNLTIDVSALASAAEAVFADNNTATVGTIDSTAQLFLQHTIAFSAASASNSATDRQMIADTVD